MVSSLTESTHALSAETDYKSMSPSTERASLTITKNHGRQSFIHPSEEEVIMSISTTAAYRWKMSVQGSA